MTVCKNYWTPYPHQEKIHSSYCITRHCYLCMQYMTEKEEIIVESAKMCNQHSYVDLTYASLPSSNPLSTTASPSYFVASNTNKDNHLNNNCHFKDFLKFVSLLKDFNQTRSHKKNQKLPTQNKVEYDNYLNGEKSIFLMNTNNIINLNNTNNASKIQQKTSLYASQTTQLLTTISKTNKPMPLILPSFSLKNSLTKKKISSCKSYSISTTSTALITTNYLLTPSSSSKSSSLSRTSQNNSCHNVVLSTYYKPLLEVPINALIFKKTLTSSNQFLNKCQLLMHLVIVFVLLITQIGFAKGDQGKF